MKLTVAALRLYSAFFLFFSASLLLPAIVSSFYKEGSVIDINVEQRAFMITILLTFAIGIILRLRTPSNYKPIQIDFRSGFIIVFTLWILAAGVGSIPFWIKVDGISFTDAYFESMSGFTTTGATIFSDVESLGYGLSLWRCMTQWFGGMGIIILFVAVLPTVGGGGYNLFRAEIPGGTIVQRIKPRISETAKSLWKVYALFSVLECLLLWGVGMPFYDSVCHTFTTMSTGGFSIKNQGIAAYNNFLIEWVIIFFMFLAGASFSLHYRMFHGKNEYFGNTEFKAYSFILFIFTIAMFGTFIIQFPEEISPGSVLRQVLFQVVSIGTTTGFTTTDYNLWPIALQLMLLTLMFIGGCTGSTGGSIKVLRHVISVKTAFRELYKATNPRVVLPMKTSNIKIDNDLIINTFSFFVFFLLSFLLGSICLAVSGMDMVSAIGGAAAAIGNVGPGLGTVGPASTYADLAPFAKWVLIVLMLLGRLELYTVLALLIPRFRPYS